MSYRLAEIDCAQARMQNSVGVSAIHVLWRYDRPVNLERIDAFGRALQHGWIGRGVAAGRLGAAGDRWTSKVAFAPLEVFRTALDATTLDDWIEERSRAPISPYGGPAWRLATAPEVGGGSIVSLLVSHGITDGRLLIKAMADAVAGVECSHDYASDRYGRVRSSVTETGAAVRQWGRVTKLHVQYRRATAVERRNVKSMVPAAVPPAQTIDARQLEPLADGFVIPRITAMIPSEQWRAVARQRGGTETTLGVAVAAALAVAVGRTTADGKARIAMPVSTRDGDDDTRANAVRGVCLDVDPADVDGSDLRPLRAQIKSALTSSAATHSAEAVVAATHQVIPRFWLARTAWSSAAPDTVTTGCTMTGRVDDSLLRVDGSDAASFAMGLINRGIENPARLARFGGNLWVAVVENRDAVALRISGFHGTTLRTQEQLRAAVSTALDGFGLTPDFW